MREFDAGGLELATFQAELFELSAESCRESSPIFLRRFFLSDCAAAIDSEDASLQSLDAEEAFASINRQYGHSGYGKAKYGKEGLYWLGYFSRYVCYTRELSSRSFYRLFDVKEIYGLYEAYHTQSEEWCLKHLLRQKGYTEADLDKRERLKAALRASLGLAPQP